MERLFWLLLFVPSCMSVMREPPLRGFTRDDNSTVQEKWLNVRLNHFSAFDTETFPMRFYYNDEFGGPHIVIFVGGEWAISAGWTQAGLAYELARNVRAGVFYTEHRYYGSTRPTNDTTVEDLRYLTVDQALGDLAQFIQYVKSDDFEGGRYKEGKVALVGCSYAGSMATWMRLAYPHIVDVAFSDSGPLLAKEDFPEYLEVITRALKEQGGEACLTGVEESMQALVELTTTAEGLQSISSMFNTCSPLQSSPLDLATLFWYGITEVFAWMVQYADGDDIPNACEVLGNTNVEPVARLASWITEQEYAQPCIDSSYDSVVARHTNVSYDAKDAVMRLWTYQTCVEYGWYQTTTSSNQPFLDAVPLEYFHHMCRDFFGDNFNEEFLRSGIERTVTMFGDLTVVPDHVVSVVGDHDPWSPVGPNYTHHSHLTPVYVVPRASHCQAIASVGTSDNVALEEAKQNVMNFMSIEMTGTPVYAGGAGVTLGSIIVLSLGIIFVMFV